MILKKSKFGINFFLQPTAGIYPAESREPTAYSLQPIAFFNLDFISIILFPNATNHF